MSSENASKIDILVEAWGYNDLLNEPTFEELPYYIHVFVGIFISVLCKKILIYSGSSGYNKGPI